MLQSSMWSQLARLKPRRVAGVQRRSITNPKHLRPMEALVKATAEQMRLLGPEEKHWYVGGDRSIATAVQLLNRGEIIALPTDTIYGFAGSVENDEAIKRLYEIKKRDERKPLAICVHSVSVIKEWGRLDDLPNNLIQALLPGPCTLVLKRTEALNPALNPGLDNVGIRVPKHKFIRCVAKLAGPLALTSANESDKPSSVHPDEFSELWPELGGIFYQQANKKSNVSSKQRRGSTVIDLTQAGRYKVLREGVNLPVFLGQLRHFGLKRCDDDQ